MATLDGEKFEIVRGTEALDITDLTTTGLNNSYAVVEFEGLGMAPLERFEQSGPAQDGASDLGFRLLPRTIRMGVLSAAGTPTQFHTRRERLLQMCRPSRAAIILRWTRADATIRQIDCHLSGGLDLPFNSGARAGRWGFRDVIVLRAADPTWYDPEGYTYSVAIGYSATGHVYPETYPTFFGTSTVSTTVAANMSDPGAWDTYPIITATGLLTSLIITNTTTGDFLSFTGNSIPSTNVWTIDTRYGYKTITDQAGTNQISKLSSASTFATFRMVAGDNAITVTASALDASAALLIQGNKRYIGS